MRNSRKKLKTLVSVTLVSALLLTSFYMPVLGLNTMGTGIYDELYMNTYETEFLEVDKYDAIAPDDDLLNGRFPDDDLNYDSELDILDLPYIAKNEAQANSGHASK